MICLCSFDQLLNAIWAVVISKSSFVMFAWRSLL